METITSRDFVYRPKAIRKLLAAGKTLRWTSHGELVALLQPASGTGKIAKPDWISRARAAGAVNDKTEPMGVAEAIYMDRD